MEHKIIQLLPCDIDPESVLLVRHTGKTYEKDYRCSIFKAWQLYTALLDNGCVQVVGVPDRASEILMYKHELLDVIKKGDCYSNFYMKVFICDSLIGRHVSSSKKICKAELIRMVKENVVELGEDIKIFSKSEYEQFYDYYLRKRHERFVERAAFRKEKIQKP